MTGGFAYIFDQFGHFNRRVNTEMVDTHKVQSPIQQQHLRELIEQHVKETNSEHAKMILNDFENWLDCFILVKPKNVAVDDLLKLAQPEPALAVRAG